MAQEATSFIIDASHSLINSGKNDSIVNYLEFTFLEKCKKMRKTDYTSLLISNTYESRNEEGIDDIVQVCSCEAPMNGGLFKKIMHELIENTSLDKIQESDEGSTVLVKTMLVSNIQMKQKYGARKIMKQIMIFSDNLNDLDIEEKDLNLINDQLETTRLILVNCSSKELSPDSEWNIIMETQRLNGLNPILVTMDQLTEKINQFSTPLVKPIRVFSGELRFGAHLDTITYLEDKLSKETSQDNLSVCMTVEGYPATKAVSGLGGKMMVKETVVNEDDTKKDISIPVKSIIEYEIHKTKVNEEGEGEGEGDKVKQEEGNNSVKNVDKEAKEYNTVVVGNKNITKAYRYGLDYVVLPPTLLTEIQYACSPGIDIRGFAPRRSLPRQYLTSESVMILPDTRSGNRGDAKAFATLVDVLLEHDKIAIARYVNKFDGNVNMACLCPMKASNANIVDIFSEFTHPRDDPGEKHNTHVKMLILTILPFAEDIKHMKFESLLNPYTNNYKDENKKRTDLEEETIENDELMTKFIKSMDMDDMPIMDHDVLYRHYSECNKNGTNLPLPDPYAAEYEKDPTMKPHTTLQYRNQALSSWIHQKYLSEDPEATFTPPALPEKSRKLVQPYKNSDNPLSQDDRDKMIQNWTTEEGVLFTSASASKTEGEVKSYIATESGPSDIDDL